MKAKKVVFKEDVNMTDSISSIPSMTEAMRVAVRHSGLKDKQVAWELDIKPQQWSLIMNGQAHFPPDKYIKFFEIVRNYIPLQWLANKCGFDLVVMQKTFEEKLFEERRENIKLLEKISYLESLISIKKTED